MSSEPEANSSPEGKEKLPQPTGEQEIRDRAYEIYLQRGAQPGYALEDWL